MLVSARWIHDIDSCQVDDYYLFPPHNDIRTFPFRSFPLSGRKPHCGTLRSLFDLLQGARVLSVHLQVFLHFSPTSLLHHVMQLDLLYLPVGRRSAYILCALTWHLQSMALILYARSSITEFFCSFDARFWRHTTCSLTLLVWTYQCPSLFSLV